MSEIKSHVIKVNQADDDRIGGRKARTVGSVQIWDGDGQDLLRVVELKRLLTPNELSKIDEHNKKHQTND